MARHAGLGGGPSPLVAQEAEPVRLVHDGERAVPLGERHDLTEGRAVALQGVHAGHAHVGRAVGVGVPVRVEVACEVVRVVVSDPDDVPLRDGDPVEGRRLAPLVAVGDVAGTDQAREKTDRRLVPGSVEGRVSGPHEGG